MSAPLVLHPDRLLPVDPYTRDVARALYSSIRDLPIISPHGHTDPQWFADNHPFTDASALLIQPDHYIFRMLYSQGISLDALGIARADGSASLVEPREVWRQLARHYYLFRGTPCQLWLDHVFAEIFGLEVTLDSGTADHYFDHINACLANEAFRPRALFERFNIEVLATTESPLDTLEHHASLRASHWPGRVITTFRPDPVVDPEFEGFAANLERLASLTGEDTGSWQGYLAALLQRRTFFKAHGATASDHGHPSAATADLPLPDCEKLYDKILKGTFSPAEAELFRAQILTEMAAMSLEDGLVMQLHPGVLRNHNPAIFARYGRDKGADIPVTTEYVRALQPLLSRFGNEPDFRLIVFTLDEGTYARELAPLAGHYPCLRLGPAWWFNDSPEGMRRFRQQTTETAGFYNTVGFNDDTRAFLSIPARHDVARRMDSSYLADLVTSGRLSENDAAELAIELTYSLAKKAYRL